MSVERLSPDDVQILRREAGAVLGHTCKLIVLAPPVPTVARLRESIASRLDAAPRLRHRLVETPLRVAGPAWVDDERFDIDHHVRALPVPAPVSREQLREIVAARITERLDRTRPLWQLDVVEGVEDEGIDGVEGVEGGGMALIWRLHHAMADGAAGIALADAVLWDGETDTVLWDGETVEARAEPWEPCPCPGSAELLALGIRDRVRSIHVPHPRRPGRRVRWLLASRPVLERELRRTAPLTPLARPVGPRRSVALALAPLDECRHAAKCVEGTATVNDCVLSLVAGGVRAWLEQRHQTVDGIRVKVPVSLHRSYEDGFVGNRDSYFFVDLPVGEPDPAQRLTAICCETRERKSARDAETLYHLGLHPLIANWAMSPRVFTFNVSNVRGPARAERVLGAPVREVYSLAEIAQEHALRVAVVSYNGHLSFGLSADGDAVPDLDVIAGGIGMATDELLSLA